MRLDMRPGRRQPGMGKATLACAIIADATDRVLYGYWTGTPQAHLDRINEFLGGRQPAQPEKPPAGRDRAEYEAEAGS